MFRSLLESFNKCCGRKQDDPEENEQRTQSVPRNFAVDEIILPNAKRMREDEGDNMHVVSGVEMRNWHKDGTLKLENHDGAFPEAQVILKKPRPSFPEDEAIEMVDMQHSNAAKMTTGSIRTAEIVLQETNAEG